VCLIEVLVGNCMYL